MKYNGHPPLANGVTIDPSAYKYPYIPPGFYAITSGEIICEGDYFSAHFDGGANPYKRATNSVGKRLHKEDGAFRGYFHSIVIRPLSLCPTNAPEIPRGWTELSVSAIIQEGDWCGSDVDRWMPCTVSIGCPVSRVKPTSRVIRPLCLANAEPEVKEEPQQPTPTPIVDTKMLTPPEGYKLLADNEVIQKGDIYIDDRDKQCKPKKAIGMMVMAAKSSWPTIIKDYYRPLTQHPTTEPKPLTEQQPTTTDMSNPYELMVHDVRQRLLKELSEQLPNQDKVKELILAELAKQSKTTIVIEDRRKTPFEVTDYKEATHQAMPDLLGILKASCWPALVGPTGSGKSLGVLQCAKILGIELVCMKQMTRILSPHELIGFTDANGHYRKGAWTDAILGYRYSNDDKSSVPAPMTPAPALLVVDEMDNANENIIMLIKAIQTGRIEMPYGTQLVNPQIQVVATMNTWGNGATREYVGRCAQDAALLNEFQFLEWNYDTSFEWELLQATYNSYGENVGDYKLTHMRRLLDMFIEMRTKAETQKIRCIISTRNVVNVTKLLLSNHEWSISKALQMSIFKGLKQEEIKRIEAPEKWLHLQKQHKNNQPQPQVRSNFSSAVIKPTTVADDITVDGDDLKQSPF